MTDPADTIRDIAEREPEAVILTEPANDRYNNYVLLTPAERDALLAERQQAQEWIAKLEQAAEINTTKLAEARAERQQAQEEAERLREFMACAETPLMKDVLEQRQQAVDALREIALGFDGDEFQDPADGQESQQAIARAALVKLGEGGTITPEHKRYNERKRED